MCSRTLEGFLLKPVCFLIFAKLEQNGGQVTFGRKGIRMVSAGVPNTTFQHFTMNHAGLL